MITIVFILIFGLIVFLIKASFIVYEALSVDLDFNQLYPEPIISTKQPKIHKLAGVEKANRTSIPPVLEA